MNIKAILTFSDKNLSSCDGTTLLNYLQSFFLAKLQEISREALNRLLFTYNLTTIIKRLNLQLLLRKNKKSYCKNDK